VAEPLIPMRVTSTTRHRIQEDLHQFRTILLPVGVAAEGVVVAVVEAMAAAAEEVAAVVATAVVAEAEVVTVAVVVAARNKSYCAYRFANRGSGRDCLDDHPNPTACALS